MFTIYGHVNVKFGECLLPFKFWNILVSCLSKVVQIRMCRITVLPDLFICLLIYLFICLLFIFVMLGLFCHTKEGLKPAGV